MPSSGPDFGPADRPALDEVARTDLLLDALAGRPMSTSTIRTIRRHALAALLGDWRDDLRWPPASALVSPEEAVRALTRGIDWGRGARGSSRAWPSSDRWRRR